MQTFIPIAHRPLHLFSRSCGRIVILLATVRDKHGQIVNNLTKDDFKLQQDGQPQNIRYFTKVTDLPLTLGLLVDTSMSQRRVLEQERSASFSFIEVDDELLQD